MDLDVVLTSRRQERCREECRTEVERRVHCLRSVNKVLVFVDDF